MNKQSYFEDRRINPQLAELYSKRLGSVATLLDIGCGRGGIGKYFTDTDVTVVGVEIDGNALKQAKEYESVIQYDLEQGSLPFTDEVFDGVIAKDILEHIIHPASIVSEMFRVLRPGGRTVVSVPMAKPRVVWNDYTHIRGFTRDAVSTMFEDQGFRVEQIQPMGGVPGAGRFNLVHILPHVLRLPILRRYAVSHELTATKPE